MTVQFDLRPSRARAEGPEHGSVLRHRPLTIMALFYRASSSVRAHDAADWSMRWLHRGATGAVKGMDRIQQDIASRSREYLKIAQERIRKLIWDESKARWRRTKKDIARHLSSLELRAARNVKTFSRTSTKAVASSEREVQQTVDEAVGKFDPSFKGLQKPSPATHAFLYN